MSARELAKRLSLTRAGLDPGATIVIAAANAVYPPWSQDPSDSGPCVLSTPGALAPAPGQIESILLQASLDYGITDIVVCGHLQCPELERALSGSQVPWPGFRRTLGLIDRHYATDRLGPGAQRELLAQENVLVQLEELQGRDELRNSLLAGALRLHGWIYEPGEGLWAYDLDSEQFEPLERPWREARNRLSSRALWSA